MENSENGVAAPRNERHAARQPCSTRQRTTNSAPRASRVRPRRLAAKVNRTALVLVVGEVVKGLQSQKLLRAGWGEGGEFAGMHAVSPELRVSRQLY